ncbi:hypothetical protein B1B_02449, partial [mine drainage metagenome]
AEYHFSQATSLLKQRKTKDAMKKLDEAITLDSSNAAYHYEKAIALLRQRQYDDSLKEFDASISLDSKNSKYHREKASAYSEMEMFDQALEEYDKAISIDPEIIDYRKDKSNLLMELSRHDEAVQSIEELLKLKSGNPDVWVTYAEALTYARGQKDGIEGLYKGIRGKSVTPKQLCEAVSDQLKKESPQSVKQMFIQYYRENCDKK